MLLVPKKRKLEDSKKVEKDELKIKEEPLSECSNSQDEKELTLMAQGATINFRRLQNFLRSFPLSNADMLTKKANCKLETVVDKNEWKDLSELQAEFRFCYKNASALKHVSLFFAIQRVFDFMSLDEASITFHYAYPKAPISAYHLFVRKLGGGKPLFLETSKRFKDDSDPLVIECKREAKKNKERFYTELRDFKERYHDELSSVHIKALENRLNTYEKANLKREDRVSTGSKIQTVEKKKTAFDFYKLSKKHTLLELPPEEREAIFCRDFDELDSKVKNIFELLEANSD